MGELSAAPGLDEADLAFLRAHCRDTAIAGGWVAAYVPWRAEALSAACITLREKDGDRVSALAVAVDRGVERQLLAVSVHHASRGEGVGRTLLATLARQHTDRDSRNRFVASVWPGLRGGSGLLISAGYSPAPGLVRFQRRAEAFESQAPRPPLRWLDLEREPDPKREDLVRAAAAACPADYDVLPTLRALASSPLGVVTAGFTGNDVKVVAAGHRAGSALEIVTAYSAPSIRDHAFAEHALARFVSRAHGGLEEVVIETAIPVPRAARTLLRLGFRAVEAAAGFRLGDPPRPPAPDVFLV
jgi:hypothetical protein